MFPAGAATNTFCNFDSLGLWVTSSPLSVGFRTESCFDFFLLLVTQNEFVIINTGKIKVVINIGLEMRNWNNVAFETVVIGNQREYSNH